MAYINGNNDFLLALKGDSVFIRYSDVADGTDFTEEWSEGQNYIGFATGQTAPTDKNGYEWITISVGDAAEVAAREATETARAEVERLVSEFGVVQTTGDSPTAVMSQKAVTDINEGLADNVHYATPVFRKEMVSQETQGNGYYSASQNRIAYKKPMVFDYDVEIRCEEGYRFEVDLWSDINNIPANFIKEIGWIDKPYVITAGTIFTLLISKADNSAITVNEYFNIKVYRVLDRALLTDKLNELTPEIENKHNVATAQAAIYVGNAGVDYAVTWENIGGGNLRLTIPAADMTIRHGLFPYGIPVNNWEDFIDASLEGKYTTTGDTLTVDIERYGSRLVFNTDLKKLLVRKTNENIVNDPNDIVLMVNGYGTPCGGLLMRYIDLGRIMALEEKAKAISTPLEIDANTRAKINQFAALFNNTENVEPFLFFTDPHLTEFSGDAWRDEFSEYMEKLALVYNETPVERVFCGGDWLGHSELQAEACYRLGLIDATMRKNFKEYHLIVGNHDTNYQGRLNEASLRYTGKLTNGTIVNLWARKTKTLYYKVKSTNTDFYVLDTNAPQNETSGYDMVYWNSQLKWLADALENNTSANIAIMLHTFIADDLSGIEAPSHDIPNLVSAFNTRNAITIDGETFNFSTAKGKIRFCMCGHQHKDAVVTLGGVPVVMTTELRDGGIPTYDLCLANYDTNTLSLVRIGTGADRTIQI